MFASFMLNQFTTAQVWNGSSNTSFTNRQGDVLIGNNSYTPQKQLHLFKNGSPTDIRLEYFTFFFGIPVNNVWDISARYGEMKFLSYLTSTSSLPLNTSALTPVEAMTLTYEGKVGIGGVNPTEKLQVLGDIGISQTGNYGGSGSGDTWSKVGSISNPSFQSLNGLISTRSNRQVLFGILPQNSNAVASIRAIQSGSGSLTPVFNVNLEKTGIAGQTSFNVLNAGLTFDLATNSVISSRIGVNTTEPLTQLFVDATFGTNKQVAILSEGNFTSNGINARFSAIGESFNANENFVGFRSQVGNVANPVAVNLGTNNNDEAELNFQDLNFNGNVSTASASESRLKINFRNNSNSININTKRELASLTANGVLTLWRNTTPGAINESFSSPQNDIASGAAIGGLVVALDARGGVLSTVGYGRTSDQRVKRGIETIEKPMDILRKLRGTTYFFNEEGQQEGMPAGKQYGVIAQELEKVMPEAVWNLNTGRKAVDYDMLIPVLIEAVKEQQQRLETLEKLLTESNVGNGKLSGNALTEFGAAVLYQNVPNPYNTSTEIPYLVEKAERISILVFDASGKPVKEYNNLPAGKQRLTINFGDLAPGLYNYSLLVDGKLIATKQMVQTSNK
jgi:hypothetical protein